MKRKNYVLLKDGKIFCQFENGKQITNSKAFVTQNQRRMALWFPEHQYTVHTVTASRRPLA